MTTRGAQPGRKRSRGLASPSWLLVLAGLSCKYDVTLPWVPEDGGSRSSDIVDDQSRPFESDVSETPVRSLCHGRGYEELLTSQGMVQVVVALDRSASMQAVQKEFDSTSKAQVAFQTLNQSMARHPRIQFKYSAFPSMPNCGSVCCASYPTYVPSNPGGYGRGGNPDGALGGASFDGGSLPLANDSPSHQALKQARSLFGSDYEFNKWQFVILMTDQNPSCSADTSTVNPCTVAIDEAENLGAMNAQLFVLAPLSEGRIPDCLSAIANKNARSFPGARDQVVVAKNASELREGFEDIVINIETRLCRLAILGPALDSDDQIAQIKIGGAAIPRSEWSLSGSEIVLSQAACSKITGSTGSPPEVRVVLDCSSSSQRGTWSSLRSPL